MKQRSSIPPCVLLGSQVLSSSFRAFAFSDLEDEIVAWEPMAVRPALAAVERWVERGRHAAGFLSYEAAPGLDPALITRDPIPGWPLVWFGIFRERVEKELPRTRPEGSYLLGEWRTSISRVAYEKAIQRIREYLAAGDTYQVNYTFRLRADFAGDDGVLYWDLGQAQSASHQAYLKLERHSLLSASPELFFSLREGLLTVKPMKGTRPRGRWPEEDRALAEELAHSPKERAENVMIVDLLRNDLGRISAPGSVEVLRLWEVERYETVWQMTSTVRSRLQEGVGLVELLTALFPSGSVTGAPKVRTMQIIAELEDSPRGIYTGCIGFVSPGLEARFNVAIRTAWIDREKGQIEFGVGGGITWDSSPEGEYEECQVKARILQGLGRPSGHPASRRVETSLWAKP